MPDADAGEAFLAVGDFKRGYFIVDHTTGVRTRPDNITEPGFYKVHTDKYLGGGVVDSNAINSGACWFLIRRVRGFGPFLPSVESNNENNRF
ncbi:phage major capsid protein, HK97 family [Klebsiella pneumoniae]|nr:phage major capsid protein [Klebsiella pneumoniae]STT63899.1 phage major capsid protein, HK97 family [Klebsiella pneumoniae]